MSPTLAWLIWAGVYPLIYFPAFTAQASTFIKYAQEGQDYGVNDLSSAATDAAQNGQTDFNAMGWHASSSQQSTLEGFYTPGGTGLSGGTALNKYASGEGQLLSDTTCPSGFPTATTSVAQFDALQSSCQSRYAIFYQYAEQLIAGDPANYSAFSSGVQSLQSSWGSAFSSASAVVNGIATDCVQAPSCDLITPAQVTDATGLWSNTTTGFPGLASYCSSLPANPGLNYSTLSQELADLSSVATNLEGLTYQNNAVQDTYNTCNYGVSYQAANMGTGGLNGYTSGTSTYDTTMNMSSFLNTTEGASLETAMLPMIEGNSSVFSQYYTPSDCTSSTTYYANATTTTTTPSTTGINSGTETTGVVCTLSNLSSWVTNFPDSNASFIWGGNTGCSTITGSGADETFEASYNNGGTGSTTGSPISATAYFAIDGSGTLTIENSQTGNTQSFNYTDNSEASTVANPPDGWISEAVTIQPGLSVVTLTDAPNAATDPAGAIFTLINNSNNNVLLDTNASQWSWMNAPTTTSTATPVTSTTSSGTAVSTGSPSASSTSDICTGTVLGCLGTACHGLINNQNLNFNQAVTASSALEMMQTNMQCEAGTSVAAGNCIPIVFQGSYSYCRNFPIAGNTFTNNCCKTNLSGGAVQPLSQYIGLIADAYAVMMNPALTGTKLGVPAYWVDKAYTLFSTWGNAAWNFVSGPFVGVAQSVMQDLGFANPAAESKMISSVNSLVSSGSSSGIFSTVSNYITSFEQTLRSYAQQGLESLGMSASTASTVITDVANIASDIMLAYTIFQMAQMIGNMLTTCKQEEYTLSNARLMHNCQEVGSYCATPSIAGCLETKTTFCCYQSPLSRIIASQIRMGQPGVAGSYTSDFGGTNYSVQSPDCAGFTPAELGTVNWSNINLSAWLALLEQSGMIQTSNQAAAANYNPITQDHPSGYVNPQSTS